jgi:hypothetical protein
MTMERGTEPAADPDAGPTHTLLDGSKWSASIGSVYLQKMRPGGPMAGTSWRRAVRDVVDVVVIGTLMIAATVFAVVALMMLDGFEPPDQVISYAALAGGVYAALSVARWVIGRHIRWR